MLEREYIIFLSGAATLGIMLLMVEYVPKLFHFVWHRTIARFTEEFRNKNFLMELRDELESDRENK